MGLQNSRTFWVQVIILALPVATQMLLQSFLGMADVMMVSNLGSSSIAAVGLAAKLHFLLLVLMSGLATGCSVLIAQYTGANDFLSSKRTLAVTLLVGVVLMVPFTFAFGIGAETWLSLINPDKEVVVLAAQYLQITAPVLILTQIIVIYEASLRALGNTAMPLAAATFSAVINIVLNYVLIFGAWGFPELGVEGAAWATLISRVAQLAFVLGWLYKKKHGFALTWPDLRGAIDAEQVLKFISFALPLVINFTLWGIGNATYHIITGYAGTEALAIMGVMVPIESTFFAIFNGIANASAIMIGQALGANQQDRAWRLYRFFDRLTMVTAFVLCVALWFGRPWIVDVFGQFDSETTQLFADILLVFCVLFWVRALNIVRIIGVLRAGGDNRFCLTVDTIAMWVIGVPIYAAAVWYGGISFLALYALMFTEDIFKALPVNRRIGRRKWIKNLADTGDQGVADYA